MRKSSVKEYVDINGKLTANALHKSYLDQFGPKSITGGDYIYRWTQGGCLAGKYLYTCMITDFSVSPTKCIIVKSDVENGTIIKYSQELELGHANDVAYNPDDNILVIANCVEEERINGIPICKKLFIVDPDTLELKKTVAVEGGSAVSIDYDAVNERYVSIGYQNDSVYLYDRNFKLTAQFKGEITDGWVSQGILCDGKYLYALEYYHEEINKKHMIKNNLRIFDIACGKTVDVVDLGIGVESESISYRDGKFYVCCNNPYWNGMECYEVEMTSIKN